MIKRVLANKIKQLRKEKNITQKSLSDILGCDQAFISKVERGVSSYNLEHIEKICAALNYPVARLFEDDAYLHEEIPPGQVAQPQAITEKDWVLIELFEGLSADEQERVWGIMEGLRLAGTMASKKGSAAP